MDATGWSAAPEMEDETMDGETLRWIWLVAGVVLLAGEMSTGGLYLLPFAVGAFAAAVLGFIGVGVAGQVVVCFVVAAVAFAAMRPLARRLDQTGITEGIGSRRLVNEPALVLAEIPTNDVGMIRAGSEEWRAVSQDGAAIPEGATVRIVDVEGTRAIVVPTSAAVPDGPETD